MRCPFAIWLPGPEWKTSGALEATGVTLHSAEYDLDPDDKILFNALHSGREASWHFTITRPSWNFPSLLFQHYEDVRTWHCGPGNPYTIGIELEGVAPAKVEGPQYDLLVRLLRWIREERGWNAVCWHRGSRTVRGLTAAIHEHQDFMSTNCAVFTNNQIDPVKLIADLEEGMNVADKAWVLMQTGRKFVKGSAPMVYVVDQHGKLPYVGDHKWFSKMHDWDNVVTHPDEVIAAIPDAK